MSQEALGEAVGKNRTHISKIENGVIRLPEVDLVQKINRTLNIPTEEFYLALDDMATAGTMFPPPHGIPKLIHDLDVDLWGKLFQFLRSLQPHQRMLLQELLSDVDRRYEAVPEAYEEARIAVDVEAEERVKSLRELIAGWTPEQRAAVWSRIERADIVDLEQEREPEIPDSHSSENAS
jgi:transcriptional regulator with XRE-family HTH domain